MLYIKDHTSRNLIEIEEWLQYYTKFDMTILIKSLNSKRDSTLLISRAINSRNVLGSGTL